MNRDLRFLAALGMTMGTELPCHFDQREKSSLFKFQEHLRFLAAFGMTKGTPLFFRGDEMGFKPISDPKREVK
jgi:hypothetical protein